MGTAGKTDDGEKLEDDEKHSRDMGGGRLDEVKAERDWDQEGERFDDDDAEGEAAEWEAAEREAAEREEAERETSGREAAEGEAEDADSREFERTSSGTRVRKGGAQTQAQLRVLQLQKGGAARWAGKLGESIRELTGGRQGVP